MQKVKSHIKDLFTRLLHATGWVWRRLDRRSNGRLIVLTYHRVLPASLQADSFSAAGIIVSPETFERNVRLLKSRFKVLSPDEAAEVLSGRAPCPRRACLITFDDGWWDNLAFAAPILAKHDVPAVLFVATDYLDSDAVFWQEKVSFQLSEFWRERHARPDLLKAAGAEGLLRVEATQLRPAVRQFVDDMKRLSKGDLPATLERIDQLFASLGRPATHASADRFLTWAELNQLVQTSPFVIASHGCSHTPFTRLSQQDLADELKRSREKILEKTGIRVVDLAYPNGDCDAGVADLTRHSGYRLAFTTERGYVSPEDDPCRLRRINIHESGSRTDALLAARLAGLT